MLFFPVSDHFREVCVACTMLHWLVAGDCVEEAAKVMMEVSSSLTSSDPKEDFSKGHALRGFADVVWGKKC